MAWFLRKMRDPEATRPEKFFSGLLSAGVAGFVVVSAVFVWAKPAKETPTYAILAIVFLVSFLLVIFGLVGRWRHGLRPQYSKPEGEGKYVES